MALSLIQKVAYEEGEFLRRKRLAFTPDIAFPSNLATYDLNFATQTYAGGIQPQGNNNDDGRFFRQQIAQNAPMLSENADGSLFSQNYQGLRIGSRGMWVERSGSANPILWNRDLTNAVWVKTNCTALKNLTGRDGATNAASRLTATADGATVLQTLSAASSSRQWVFDIAIISGSGVVQYTIDNGATWTNIPTPVFKNGIWSRVRIPNQTVGLNAVVGFKLQTNGDVVGFDLQSQNTGTIADSPVIQTTAPLTRQRDRPSTEIIGGGTTAEAHGSGFADYINANADWGLYAEWEHFEAVDNAVIFGTNLQVPSGSTDIVRWAPGTGTPIGPANTIQFSSTMGTPVVNKCIALCVGGQGLICLNGGTVVTGAVSGPYTALTHFDVLTNGAGAACGGGVMRRLALLTTNLDKITPAMAQAFTT